MTDWSTWLIRLFQVLGVFFGDLDRKSLDGIHEMTLLSDADDRAGNNILGKNPSKSQLGSRDSLLFCQFGNTISDNALFCGVLRAHFGAVSASVLASKLSTSER
jgi:hypothetical protein